MQMVLGMYVMEPAHICKLYTGCLQSSLKEYVGLQYFRRYLCNRLYSLIFIDGVISNSFLVRYAVFFAYMFVFKLCQILAIPQSVTV